MGLLWLYTFYQRKKENLSDISLQAVNAVRGHIEYAMKTEDAQMRSYHLQQAENSCISALQDLGGGYIQTPPTTYDLFHKNTIKM